MGYTRAEIKSWFDLRDPLTHADLRKASWVATGYNLEGIVSRMKQACVDVLFNKDAWHDPSATRRQVWSPEAITVSPDGKIIVKENSKNVSLLTRVFDEFGIYPIIWEISVDHSNDKLYYKFNAAGKTEGEIIRKSLNIEPVI